MRIRNCVLALLVSLAPVALHSSPVQAQPAKDDPFIDMARKRFEEGVKLYDQGRYEEARAAFLQAWALKKHPAVLLNLAQSELRSNHPVEAARHFAQYLREASSVDPGERKAAEQGLTAARTKTSRVEITVNVPGADIFVDDELVGRAPLPEAVDVAGGNHKIEARLAGYETGASQVAATVGKRHQVAIQLRQTGAAAPGAAPSPGGPAAAPLGPPGAGGTEPTEDTGFEVSSAGRQPFPEWLVEDKVGWVTAGVTGVGLIVGLTFTILAGSAGSDAESVADQIVARANGDPDMITQNRTTNPCADPIPVTLATDYNPACQQLRDNLDKEDTNRTVSYVGWGLLGAGAVATVALYFVRSKTEDAPAEGMPAAVLTPVVGPGMNGLSLMGSF